MNLHYFIENNNISYYETMKNDMSILHNPCDYINRYLAAGDKRMYEIEHNDTFRYEHTASIYVLGLLIYSKLSNLNEMISRKTRENKREIEILIEDEFLYSWFLICFIHDLACEKANDRKTLNTFWNTKSLMELEFKMLSKLKTVESRESKVVPPEIRSNIIKYQRYKKGWTQRNDSTEIVDHGYLAGLYFLDDRKKKFALKKQDGSLIEIEKKRYHDNDRNLIWSEDILNNEQKDICDIIIAHNIFYAKKGSNDTKYYKEFDLDNLIISEPNYKFMDYPLFYLLQLVDTIDPYKFFSRFNKDKNIDIYNKILSDINYSISENKICMRFNNIEIKSIYKYFRYLKKQTYWLPIHVRISGNRVLIYLN